MTGGQMAPTTLLGQKAKTAPSGRDADAAGMGYPIRVSELLCALDGTRYIARGAVNNAANIRKTRKYIKKAFGNNPKGYKKMEQFIISVLNYVGHLHFHISTRVLLPTDFIVSNLSPYVP
jgi:pyruvate/2-oxoacid:ferredoxin oxidoreductase beta subunit